MATSEADGAAVLAVAPVAEAPAAIAAAPATRSRQPRKPARGSRASPAAPLLAYVLHRYDWSETSLIVELMTRDRGRIAVAAKGAKRPTSQLRPVLLPFHPLHAVLGKAPADEQGEIHLLRGAEWTGGRPLLPAGAMFAGYYLNELLLKLLPRHDPHAVLFDAYAETVAALASSASPGAEAALLRGFELTLLREIGWLPELATATLTAQPLRPDERYALDAEAGIVAHPQGIAGGAWVALEAALAHGSVGALQAACVPVAAALRDNLRTVLHYHLGRFPLRTREVWHGVQRLAEPPPARR